MELLQPSSAIAGALLALMLLNVARVALLASRGRSSNPAEREQALQSRITQWALQGFAGLAPLLGAVAAMLYRRLSGQQPLLRRVQLCDAMCCRKNRLYTEPLRAPLMS